ncbi:MAG: transcriptional regulator NrdR [Nitratireductor sp.]
MRCPYCSSPDSQVKDSRPTDDNTSIRRRRICNDCAGRFTTFERVQLRELVVLKKSGKRIAFDRDKLVRSVATALRKRDIDTDRFDRMITGIVRQLEQRGEDDIPTSEIGRLVLEGLRNIDQVAYVRFASVYQDFKEVKDFEAILGMISNDDKPLD